MTVDATSGIYYHPYDLKLNADPRHDDADRLGLSRPLWSPSFATRGGMPCLPCSHG
jgi:hypothetical protein